MAAGIAGPLIVNGFLDAAGTPGKLTAADYRPALFTMAGVLAVVFVANLLIKPVHARFHEPEDVVRAAAAADEEAVEEVERSGAASASSVRVYVSWGIVVALLAYGVFQTLVTATKLFARRLGSPPEHLWAELMRAGASSALRLPLGQLV